MLSRNRHTTALSRSPAESGEARASAEPIRDHYRQESKHVRKVFVHSGQLSAAPSFLEVAEKLLQKSTLLRAFT